MTLNTKGQAEKVVAQKAEVKHFGALHGQWLNNGAVQVKTIEEDNNNAED